MEIDPHNLPSEVNLLQQIVLQLLQAVEDKDQLLARVQHQLAQLLRYRYGQKRERIDENQLFLFAAQIIAASQRASAAPSSEEPAADSSSRTDGEEKKEKPVRRGHGRKALPESLERRRVLFDLEESQRQCGQCQTPMRKIGDWWSLPTPETRRRRKLRYCFTNWGTSSGVFLRTTIPATADLSATLPKCRGIAPALDRGE